jgi:predicted RecB family nuclease
MWPEEFELPQAAAFSASSVASLRGNLIQTILEFVYKHDFLSLSASQLVQSLQASWRWGVEEYHPLRFITIEELVAIRTDIFSHLQGILVNINDHHLYGPPGTVKMEEPLWWDLPSVGVRLTGRADMIIDDASTARFWLLDGKYTQKPQFLEKDQLSFYALILQHMCKKQVNRACFWLYPSYQVWDLSDSCLTQQALYNVQQKATKVAHDLLDKNTQATPSRDACIFCQHKEYCPEHQDWSRQSMIIPGTRK